MPWVDSGLPSVETTDQNYFDVATVSITSGKCTTLKVVDVSKNTSYRYWVTDDAGKFRCGYEIVGEGQGDPSGGGELGGGS